MAEPAAVTLVVTGQEKTFLNSGDMRLILTGYAPTVQVGDPSPIVGSLQLQGQAPSLGTPGQIPVPAGSIATRGHYEKWGVGLVIQGQAPTIPATNTFRTPSSGSVSITGQNPERLTGLKTEGFAPTLAYSWTVFPSSGAISFSSDEVERIVADPSNPRKAPPRGQVATAGAAPTLGETPVPSGASLAFTGAAPTALSSNIIIAVGADALVLVGKQPKLGALGNPAVIIGPGFNEGTVIRNTNATTNVPVNYVICDRTGFKQKVKEPLARDWTGNYVRQESWDNRMDQNAELVRGRRERYKKGPLRPEPVGDEDFIEDLYPNGVTTDDL